jgi:hypothetical protein
MFQKNHIFWFCLKCVSRRADHFCILDLTKIFYFININFCVTPFALIFCLEDINESRLCCGDLQRCLIYSKQFINI